MDPAELAERLRQAPALRFLKPPELEALIQSSELVAFPPGEVLLEEDGPADCVLFLVDGRVQVSKRTESGVEIIAVRGAGDWIGEFAVLDPGVRSASALSESSVRALVVPRHSFLEIVTGNPDAVLDLLGRITERVRESDTQLIEALRKQVRSLSSSNEALERQNRRLRAALGGSIDLDSFVGTSVPSRAVRDSARQAAGSDVPVLLVGETGTGKELLARAIHAEGARAEGPFVAVNCGLMTESLLESELFGHARGAFTGALQPKRGLLEAADGGTLFLDEIGDMPRPLQAALLRFLELGEFRRVGETQLRHAHVRVVSATHREPDRAVEDGSFRADLLYRLDVIRIEIPPLRERSDDVEELVRHCLRLTANRLRVPPLELAPAALERLECYRFPGNVRELENEIERLYVFLEPGSVVEEKALSPKIAGGSARRSGRFADQLRDFKVQAIEKALRESGGNRTRAAEQLGVHRANLARMVRDLGLSVPTAPRRGADEQRDDEL
jgi:transcriptional regulator with PAS, ATPase and Fis domain